MVAIGQQNLDSSTNLFLGGWSHVAVIQDPLGSPTEFYLGQVNEGVMEISREDFTLVGVGFPRVTELVIPTSVGMKFSGQMLELHKRNLHLMLGNLPGTASNYLYPGTACPDETKFVRFNARRIRCDGFVMDVVFWKSQSNGLIQIGDSENFSASPMEINALDDVNGDFGGSTTAPLGYIYAPDPAV